MAFTKLLRRKTVELCKLEDVKTSIETLITSGDADLTQVQFYSKELHLAKSKVDEVMSQILADCTDNELDTYLAESKEITEKYNGLSISLSRLEVKVVKPCDSVNSAKDFKREVKLPKLELPVFSGAICEWLSFSDLFKATVHENPAISDAQKLQYLKSVLRGEPAQIIQSMPIVNSNYKIAWDLLSERYSNNRELVFAHIRKIMSQPNIQCESATSILNLVDTTNECVRALEILGQKVSDFSDIMILYVVQQKLDQTTKLWWERNLKGDQLPKLADLTSFLKDHARSLQASKIGNNQKKVNSPKLTSMTASFNNNNNVCKLCKNNSHKLFKCSEFVKLSIEDRVKYVKTNNLCLNCLGEKHSYSFCKSMNSCFKCGKKHHSLLHFIQRNEKRASETLNSEVDQVSFCNASAGEEKVVPSSKTNNQSRSVDSETPVTSCHGKVNEGTVKHAMLATVLIRVTDSTGNEHFLRGLFDAGSQANFISERAVQLLRLKRKAANYQISALGSELSANTQGVIELIFSPHFDREKTFCASFLVLRNITSNQPHCDYNYESFKHLTNLTLADPKWYEPGPIDILLGVSVSLQSISGDKIFGRKGMPFAINSEFGWLIAGDSDVCITKQNTISVNHITLETDEIIKRFWECETIPSVNLLTKEERECELSFQQTHSRDSTGRFFVHLPFKSNCGELGESRELAVKRFENLERNLNKQPTVYDKYRNFMQEYIDLGHMERVPLEDIGKQVIKSCYLPHHFVIKSSSSTTKLRVVFDASAKTTTGISLNDKLMIGPRVQQELFAVLLRFRLHPVAITADIHKMYRMIKVYPEDADFQRIVWRNNPHEEIVDYKLLTVTYGTAAAPFLATRVLKQLAIDEGVKYPRSSKVMLEDFYVDDVLTGANSDEEAVQLIMELDKLTKSGGLELRKWASNRPVLDAANIPTSLRETHSSLDIMADESIKVLGITWHPVEDKFKCYTSIHQHNPVATKRAILSEISAIFDPMGWIAPFVVMVKILLQNLWRNKLSWDDPIPDEFLNVWTKISKQLENLNLLDIPRTVILPEASCVQLHAFCDASEKAYASVIYLRSISGDNVCVRLLVAKTRVAPLKTITLPRLELCAALLQAQLLEQVQIALALKVDRIYAWTDSTIVLSWLSSEPKRWQTFVANRVATIQQIIPTECWNHIRGKENPADCASRGLLPSELVYHKLWWNGPPWLGNFHTEFQSAELECVPQEALKEERKEILCCAVPELLKVPSIIFDVSSLSKLQRIIAWCLRFITNARLKPLERSYSMLTASELNKALMCVIRAVQYVEFSSEIQCIRKGKSLPVNSKIANLCPFIDTERILRVGGRLRHSDLPKDQMHPILLPKKHHLTNLIIQHFHLSHLHAGPQLLLSVLRQRFWIPCGRDVIRYFIKKCVVCFRVSASTANQLMADLPSSRVLPSRAFSRVGVDYAGPFICKERTGRGKKTFKCYIALFVCFCTRAIHLEIVSDLSTQAFIAALKRFISRRGKPQEITSDCATNFVGASRELKSILKSVFTSKDTSLSNFVATEGIQWSFNPPAAPHFGGLWEAGVKSMKFHLKRTMGNSLLTFEELSTLTTQIEACLNSRPLCPLSSDPNDLCALTPGHFLIGTALTSLPELDLAEIPTSRLDRWQLVQRTFQHFWKRWSGEYLSRLQQRPKWCATKPNFTTGDLVLIKNELLPSLRWKLARIVKVHPGKDGHVRVVTLKTDSGELKRPIVKLCKLPLD